ncbi:MAG: Flp pilus assembly protein CpaB [Gemmobacter sp.]
MRAMFGLVLVVGLALAGVAVYMVQGFVGANQAELAKERAFRAKIGPFVEVYVTNKPLVYGAALTKDDVQKVLMPKNNLPEGFFEDEATLFPSDDAKPRFIIRQMDKMEPVLAAKVSEPGQDVGLTARLSKGMRAFAIKVDVASGVSGFLQPGDVVDVYWTGGASDTQGELTQLIESSIKIVAVDQTADAENTTSTLIARTVTVEATPEEVARLAQAQATGRLALSLVGANDVSEAGFVEVDGNALLGIQEQAEAVIVEEKVCSIKTRKGADLVETPIPCTN